MAGDQKRRSISLNGALALLTITSIAYLPALAGDFVWDDDLYVAANPHLRSLEGLGRIWFEPGATPQYYPLTFTSFWLEYQIWRGSAVGYHVVNILLHVVNAVLLWRILAGLGVPGAWLAAALFGVHPLHVESVAWITERKNVLSGCFYLASALLYLRFLGIDAGVNASALAQPKAPASSHRRRLYVLSSVLFLFAALSKSVTATLPVVILLACWWARPPVRFRDLIPLAPFLAIGLAAGAFTAYFERRHVGAEGAPWSLSPAEHVLLAGRVFWFYLGKLAWPAELIFIYPRWNIHAGSWPEYLYPATALVLIGALSAGVLFRNRGRGLLLATAVYAASIFPALGFFSVYFMRFSWVADHFCYLASIAPLTLAALTIHRIGRSAGAANTQTKQDDDAKALRSSRRHYGLVSTALIVALTARTFAQSTSYLSAEILWRDTLARNPDAWIAHNNLGLILAADGKLDEAIPHFRKACDLRPDAAQPHSNLGMVLARHGDAKNAIRILTDAVALAPEYFDARYNLATAYLASQRWHDAERAYRAALALRSASADAHYGLAVALKEQGRSADARVELDAALRINPAHRAARAALNSLNAPD